MVGKRIVALVGAVALLVGCSGSSSPGTPSAASPTSSPTPVGIPTLPPVPVTVIPSPAASIELGPGDYGLSTDGGSLAYRLEAIAVTCEQDLLKLATRQDVFYFQPLTTPQYTCQQIRESLVGGAVPADKVNDPAAVQGRAVGVRSAKYPDDTSQAKLQVTIAWKDGSSSLLPVIRAWHSGRPPQ